MVPAVFVAGFIVLQFVNAGAFSDPEAKAVPEPCTTFASQVELIVGGQLLDGSPSKSHTGPLQQSRCTWEANDRPVSSLEVEYSLHHRSDGNSGIDGARIGLKTDVQVGKVFPKTTTVTSVPQLGDEAFLLVGRFSDAEGLTITTVVGRRANVVISAKATSRGQGVSAKVAEQLKQLVATAIAGIEVG